MFFLSKKRNNKAAGFTLTELLVSMGIAVSILTVVIVNQSTYIDGASLRNLADNISLSLSQAQIYSTGVKEVYTGSNEFTAAYGMEFNITSSGNNNSYIFFADRGAKNRIYDNGWACPIGGASECLEKTVISNGNVISQLCHIPTSGPEDCTIGRIDITFQRPDTNAIIVFFNMGGGQVNFSNTRGARIQVRSPAGKYNSIIVYNTGQISVQ